MRSPILALLALTLAMPAAHAEEDPSADPGPTDAREDHAREVSAVEVRVPGRGQYVPTRRGHALGDFTATFFATELITFEDNIFRTERNERSDTVFATTLGARLTTEGARATADLAAALTQESFARNSGEGFLGGWLDLGSRFGMERGAFLGLTDRLSVREDALSTSLSAPGNPVLVASGARVRQVQNDAGLTVGVRGEKSALEVRYDRSSTDFGSPLDPLGRLEHRGTLIGRRSPSPKSEVNAQLEARAVRFDTNLNNDYDAYAAYAGALWIATPKTTLEGRAGFLTQNVSAGGTTPDDSEFSGTIGSLNLLHEVGPELFVEGVASRDVFPALGSNYQLVNLVGTEARWEFRPDWLARAGLTWQDSRNSAGPDGSFYTVLLGLSWNASDRWEASLLYEYRQFQGNLGGTDFVNNRIGLQVSVNF